MHDLPFEAPDDFWERMPNETYCKCGATWTERKEEPGGVTMSLRIKCSVCGYWTGPVPSGEK